MAKQTDKNEISELRSFLIKNFLIILAFVIVAEYAILQLVNLLFLPFFQTFFFGKAEWNGNLSASQMVLYLIFLLAELVLLAINSALPAAAQPLFQRAVRGLEDMGSSFIPEMAENFSIQLDRVESLVLFAVIFAIFTLLAVPYGIGAVWYARITTRKVHDLQDKRDAMQEEYNRKRNRHGKRTYRVHSCLILRMTSARPSPRWQATPKPWLTAWWRTRKRYGSIWMQYR